MKHPTEIRLSEHFLLSDFMMCHSMVTEGFSNVWDDSKDKLAQAKHLCETLLEPLLAERGPASISYGYISPELSRNIVKYQDPNKPSYHRWEIGAAADVCFHDWVKEHAPIHLAHEIDIAYPYSRMITYSESPFICLATNLKEEYPGRRAFYENRYEGVAKAKPKYITKPKDANKRTAEGESLELHHDWRGAGYPTYHGGGIRQAQHVRLGRYVTLLDFLNNRACYDAGRTNIPSHSRADRKPFYAAGRAFSRLLETLKIPRLSIVRGFESHISFPRSRYNWLGAEDGFIFECVPPARLHVDTVAHAAQGLDGVDMVSVDSKRRRVAIGGQV